MLISGGRRGGGGGGGWGWGGGGGGGGGGGVMHKIEFPDFQTQKVD